MWNLRALLLCGVLGFPAARDQALGAVDSFSVATYNLENYLDESAGPRHPKTEAAKDKIREMIRAMKPDVLAVEDPVVASPPDHATTGSEETPELR